jgi:hypothetical protein
LFGIRLAIPKSAIIMKTTVYIKILTLCLSIGITAIVRAGTINIIFDNPTGLLGTSQTYTDGPVTLTAYGYDSSGPSNLYGKADGGDEDGIGLANDPHGDHEIVKGSFVQLDISQLLLNGYNSAEIFVGSTQGTDEPWDLFASNTLGTLGTLKINSSAADFPTGVDITSLLGFQYLSVTAHNATGVGDQNVLLSGITANSPSRVPDSGASLELMSIGAAMLLVCRWRIKTSPAKS